MSEANCFDYSDSDQTVTNISLRDVRKSDTTQRIILLDVKKLITSNVPCGSVSILAILDTGAAVTVISPELLAKAEFQLKA